MLITPYTDHHSCALMLLIGGLSLAYYLVLLPIYNIFFHPLSKYPGPNLWAASVLPWALMFVSGNSHHKLLELHDKYGLVVRQGPNELSYIDPQVWEDIMGRHKAGLRNENPKAPWYCSPKNKDIIGAPHEDHMRMRRLLANGFSASTMIKQQPLIRGYIDLLTQRLREKAANGKAIIDMHAWYNYRTFDIIGDLAFGEAFGCLRESAMHPWISLVFANIRLTAFILVCNRIPIFYVSLPLFVFRKLFKQFKEHQQISREKVAKRLALKDSRPDFIQDMISGKAGLSLSHEELNNNAVILTLAGSETTATALAGATYFIATNPRVKAEILNELRSTFTSEDEIDLLSVAKLPYLCAVTEECLRMYPPGPNAQPRITPAEGNVILGDRIPGNTVLGIPHRAMYLSERNFKRAKEFIPERWLNDPEFANDRRDCFYPFSYGPRNCIGMNLAYAEFRLILARIMWNFEIEIAQQSQDWMQQQQSYLLWQKPALFAHLVSKRGRE